MSRDRLDVDNTLTVGELRRLLAGQADNVVVAVRCCQSSHIVHVGMTGTKTYEPTSYDPKGFTADFRPDLVEVERYGLTLVFDADDDFANIVEDDDAEDGDDD